MALKRLLDLIVSALGLLLLAPLFLLFAIIIVLDSRGPVFYRQERMGRDFQPFQILKLRTMAHVVEDNAPQLTLGDDPRVTRFGAWLRATKLDELPQLYNVLRGEMSLVGPRPEVCRYVEMFRDEYRDILRVRPGMTDPASLAYRDEPALLSRAADPEQEYVRVILPEKLRLSKEYVARASVGSDIKMLFQTAWRLLH